MADENVVEDGQQEETVETAQEPLEGTESDEQTESQGEGTPEGEEVPAEVLREKVTKANQEAARYRTQLREAQDALSKAKTVEEFEAATKEFTEKIQQLEVENLKYEVAVDSEIPAKAIKFLTGSTKEELEASAAELKELFGQPAPKKATSVKAPASGGLNPSEDAAPVDRDALRKQMRAAGVFGR
jgi:hypothetical protein